LIHEFVTAYQQEYNRLRREQTNAQAAAHAELAEVERQIRNIVEAVKAGLFAPAMKDELAALAQQGRAARGGGRDMAVGDLSDPARARGGGAGDRARGRTRRDFCAQQREKPPAFWGSTGNAGCGRRI
jgi:hypothetical protein